MSNQELAKTIAKMTFEEAMVELEKVVTKLETGQEPLDVALQSYEYGSLLRKHCEEKLREARLKVEQITKNEDGSDKLEEFN